jgi:hypothetical protein
MYSFIPAQEYNRARPLGVLDAILKLVEPKPILAIHEIGGQEHHRGKPQSPENRIDNFIKVSIAIIHCDYRGIVGEGLACLEHHDSLRK